jgi:hypothetical protein
VVKSGLCSCNEYGIGGEHETEPKETQPPIDLRVTLARFANGRIPMSEGAVGIFGGDQAQNKKDDASIVARLYQQIDQLKIERDFLESALGR